MKTKIKLSALLFIASITVSCDNFLEEKNQSNITAENYFVTADGYRSLVNAAYSTFKNSLGRRALVVLSRYRYIYSR